MFTLRRITKAGVQMNQAIGDSYTFVDREVCYDEFCRSFKHYFNRDHVADLDPTADDDTRNVYAFVEHVHFVQPLFKSQNNYIMTAGGKTFDNVNFR